MTRSTGPDKATVERVWERADGCCERCGRGLTFEGRGRWWSIQHRCPRGSGGSKAAWVNQPSNLLVLCGDATDPRFCHSKVEKDRTAAENGGFLIRHGIHLPAEIPFAHPTRGTVFITDDGAYTYEPPEET